MNRVDPAPTGARIVVFAPLGDDALRTIHWVGVRTVAALDARGAEVVALRGVAATRGGLEEVFPVEGAVLCAHGSERRVIGADGRAAVDSSNVDRLLGAWVHALACRTATELAHEAIAAGAIAWAGYDVSLLVQWSPEDLAGGVEAPFTRLVLAATLALANREFDQRRVRRMVAVAADDVEAWCQEHEDEPIVFWLRVTAEQLTRVIVLASPASS